MQYLTSQQGGLNRVQRVAIVIGVLLVFGFLFLLFQPRDNQKSVVLDDEFLNTYRDPITGEVVTDADNKTNESIGEDFPTPTLLGFSKLLTVGFSQGQIDALILALGNFSTTEGFVPNEISLYPDSITFEDADPNSFDIDVVRLKLRISRSEDISAVVTRNSLSTITLTLLREGSQIFQLGPIDADSFERS